MLRTSVIAFFTLAACSNGPQYPPPERLLQPTPERLAAAQDEAPEFDASRPELTTEAEFDAFFEACLAEQPEVFEAPEEPLGIVWQGDRELPLPRLPEDNLLRLAEGNPEFIDPNKVAESAGHNIASNLFETLLVPAAGNSPPEPGAAERYERSEDGKTYTFYLRKGMVWSDGQPVTAHDYEFGWKRGLSPELGSRSAQQLWVIEGAREYNEGKKAADEVGVKALDDHTLEVKLVGPAPYFPDLVTYIAYTPIPRWAVEAHGEQWTRVEHIVTNGPFLLTGWRERDRVELTRNDRHWDAKNIKLEGAIFFITDSEAQIQALYDSGQVHVAYPLSPDMLQQAIRDGRFDLRIERTACVYYYHLRQDHPPLDDPRVRLALNQSIDKSALVNDVLGSMQSPATSLTPPLLGHFMGYVPPEAPPRDPQKAASYLAAAGFPGGKGFPELNIIYNTSEGHKRIAEFVSRSWEESLGIPLKAANMEWKSLLQAVQSGSFEMARTAWCADYPDPLNFLEIFHSASDNNHGGYTNPAYDLYLDRSRNEADEHRRRAQLCAAEKGLLRDLPMVLMYQYTTSMLIRPEVQGLLPQYQNHHPLRWISLEKGDD